MSEKKTGTAERETGKEDLENKKDGEKITDDAAGNKKEGDSVEPDIKNINENIAEQVQARVDQEQARFSDAAEIEDSGEITREFVEQCFKENQRGDGMIFARLFKDEFLYNHFIKSWMIFEDHRWKVDVIKKHLTAVEKVAQVYLQEAIRVGSEIVDYNKKEQTDAIKKKAIKLTKKRNALWARVNRLYGDKGFRNYPYFKWNRYC
jgi:CRISPR-associated protein Cas8b1/Cst1 subtype I-B